MEANLGCTKKNKKPEREIEIERDTQCGEVKRKPIGTNEDAQHRKHTGRI